MLKFGSLLKDHPEVLRQSKLYPTLDVSLWWDNKTFYRTLPSSFDGREAWQAYTCFPGIQRCADSWALVAKDILADRFTLSTGGEIALQLSETEIVACIDTPPKSHLKNVNSSNSLNYQDACQGYSIYDSWEYMYANGIPENNCFSHKKLQDHKPSLKLPEQLNYIEKKELYGELCQNIEDDQQHCIWKYNGLPVARRSFFCNGIINITQYDNGSFLMDKTIEAIKYELLRYGPVAAGFLVYENFSNDYDGTTIYEKTSGKPLGGHYVSIMGWGKEKDTEYWICRNSWGTDWGLVGFFKMKIGIIECMLEQNVSTVAAYVYKFTNDAIDTVLNGKTIDFTDMKKINPQLFNKSKKNDLDMSTFYVKETLELVKEGKLYGSLEPLILNPRRLIPNQRFYWVEDFKNFKFINLRYEGKKEKTHYIFIIAFIFVLFIGYKTSK